MTISDGTNGLHYYRDMYIKLSYFVFIHPAKHIGCNMCTVGLPKLCVHYFLKFPHSMLL